MLIEFECATGRDGVIALPPDVARQLPAGAAVHVSIRWNGNDADDAWRTAGRVQFETAFAPEDSVYEQLATQVNS